MLDAGLRAPSGVVVRAAGNTLYRRMGWKYYSTDRLGPGTPPDVDWVSSLSLGGLSNFWTAAVPRFAPEDFTEGGRLDERYVWPIAYEELVPFYELAEGMLQVTAGERDTRRAVQRANVRVPAAGRLARSRRARHRRGPRRRGPSDGQGTSVDDRVAWHRVQQLPLRRAAAAVVTPIPSRVGRPGHTDSKCSGAAGHADGVEYVDRRSGTSESVRGRAVVIAAGAIDSTTIVLRSTSPDFPHGIGNSAGLVGRYLHDHPREWWQATSERPLRALAHPVYAARTPHGTGDPLLATSLTLGLSAKIGAASHVLRWPDVHVRGAGVRHHGADPGPSASHSIHRRTTIRGHAGPRSRCATTSGRSTTWSRHATGFAICSRPPAFRSTCPGRSTSSRPGSSIHFGGTLRMHADPAFGVVDAWNRMHDVPNVVVCDSSCFTTGPEKNPTLTAMAIALPRRRSPCE